MEDWGGKVKERGQNKWYVCLRSRAAKKNYSRFFFSFYFEMVKNKQKCSLFVLYNVVN